MKTFYCQCGQKVFFDNNVCTNCGRRLGFDPSTLVLASIDDDSKLCQNTKDYDNCNWLTSNNIDSPYCLSCYLNDIIPNLAKPSNKILWSTLESAKRHLIYTLLCLQLPIQAKTDDVNFGIAFRFMEDHASNPLVTEEHISTGHLNGVITINVAEADPVSREIHRTELNEPYRTLIGHFRHESGHLYWSLLVGQSDQLEAFRQLFGDEREDYGSALDRYHQQGPASGWEDQYISAYCQAHPVEDWAESWAHYLHMFDGLETAVDIGLISEDISTLSFVERLNHWYQLTIKVNAMNRSLGLIDPYPFVLSAAVSKKLEFIENVIRRFQQTNQ